MINCQNNKYFLINIKYSLKIISLIKKLNFYLKYIIKKLS